MLELLGSLRLGFAFTAGAATFFAPCAAPMLPAYLAFYLGLDAGSATAGNATAGSDSTDSRRTRLRRAAVVAGVASLGLLLVFGALAAVVAAVGTGPLGNLIFLEVVIGVALILLGVGMATGTTPTIRLPLPARRRSRAGYLLFGAGYGAAAAGCTAPIFVAVILTALGGGPTETALTFGAYALGMITLLVGVTVAAALGAERVTSLIGAASGRIERVAGILLIVAGAAQLYLFYFRFGGRALLFG